MRDGYLVIQPSVPGGDAFHERMFVEAGKLHSAGDVGNNLLADIPGIDAVLDAPEVVGAFTALLGEDYVLQTHRHCHVAMEQVGIGNQRFHKDGFYEFRHMLPTDVMMFYYPQEVTPSMGPTAVLPGSQYSREKPPAEQPVGDEEPHCFVERILTLPSPGACVLMHFHLWHRATVKLGSAERARYMFKFLFRRARPFLPAPDVLGGAIVGDNPFVQGVCNDADEDSYSLACAAVWATLGGAKLRAEDALRLSSKEFNIASGDWPATVAAMTVLLPALSDPAEPDAKSESLYEAAGALQLCSLPHEGLSGRIAAMALAPILGPRGSRLLVHPWDSEWRLEVLAALPALLCVESALSWLVPLISASQCPRTQTRALMGVYASGIRCGAPLSESWRAAVGVVPLDEVLLQCTARWESWLTHVKGTSQSREMLTGRYTLAESLRCIGRFCAPELAQKALVVIGSPERVDLCDGPGWRKRFANFVERRRRCPATSPMSPF